MAWAECKPRTEIITIEEFWYKYGDDIVKKLNGKTPIEVEQTDKFIIEAIGVYEKKKWYQKKELIGVKLAYLRYEYIG